MEKFIAESIESILQQTFREWELLIVDDESTDDTKKICLQYCRRDVRIKYFYQPNGRQGKARNLGIHQANAPLIAFLDADDIWEKNFLEKQLAFKMNTQADLVFSNIVFINERSIMLPEKHFIDVELLSGREGICHLLQKNQVPLSTVLVEKACLMKVGGFQESTTLQYGEDFRLWLQLLTAGFVFQGTKETLARYRKHPEQSSQSNGMKYIQQMDHIRQIPTSLKLEKEKNKAIALWLYRKLLNSREIQKQGLIQDIKFFPASYQKFLSAMAIRLLPVSYARKVMCLATKL